MVLVDLLVDVVDIILHCINHNNLNSRSLSEVSFDDCFAQFIKGVSVFEEFFCVIHEI